jgi:hypothetical protein
MVHYSRLSKIVIDVPAADHDRELAFWSAATGQPLAQFSRHPEYHGAALHGQDLWLLIQRLDQGQAGCISTSTPTTQRRKSPDWKNSAPSS